MDEMVFGEGVPCSDDIKYSTFFRVRPYIIQIVNVRDSIQKVTPTVIKEMKFQSVHGRIPTVKTQSMATILLVRQPLSEQ